MASSGNYLVRSEVKEVRFGFYTEEELRALSVCHVTSPLTFDALGNALRGGLYDTSMGPRDQASHPCTTCGLIYMNCPGHPGHLELCVPVYHPMHFPGLFLTLQGKCVACHKLRMAPAKQRVLLLKLKLLEMGDVEGARDLDALVTPPVTLTGATDAASKEAVLHHSKDIESSLRRLEARYTAYRRAHPTQSAAHHLKRLQAEVVHAALRACAGVHKCESCGATSPKLRKDGFTKIYQRASSKKAQADMKSKKYHIKSGMEALADSKQSGKQRAGTDLADDDDSSIQGEQVEVEVEEEVSGKKTSGGGGAVDKYLAPLEVEAQLQLLWRHDGELLDFIWSRSLGRDNTGSTGRGSGSRESWRMFLTRTVLVPPSRFRPPSAMGAELAEHPQNVILSSILNTNEAINRLRSGGAELSVTQVMTQWIALQNAVNCFIDSDKDNSAKKMTTSQNGIRQLLERKEGLFRRHMMGKRVNFCCRSVISPDLYIGTNEIGIPVRFATALHIPTPVTTWNVKQLREMVERGPNVYPGANSIETGDGRVVNLARLSDQERVAKSRLLLSTPGTKVHRHLLNGDALLVNRQPTLHKAGIMAHRARVLEHVPEQTLRMHYTNCNAYNADFDGDEINCHFVQNQLARAEANYICNTDNQYIGPTSGAPLRGLIQDHVASAVKLTNKNTFLTRADFQQLLYVAVSGLPGTEVVTPLEDMVMPAPAIVRPRELWTGKQVITALLMHVCRPPLPALHLDGKARTPATALGAEQSEHVVVFRYNELLSGVLDKAAIGNSNLGVVHAVYELYGAELAGRLLSAFGRLFTCHLQDAGQTCGVQDLVLTVRAELERHQLLEKVRVDADHGLLAFLKNSGGGGGEGSGATRSADEELTQEERLYCEETVSAMLATDLTGGKVKLDGVMQGVINKSASDVIKACLPNGLQAGFLANNFSMMVLTGAKGSAVNQSQISCFLGQQALEGQRVPIMVSGKSLPSFRAYDSSARAGGFVQDRFLTGVKPQEYYFHCMAGREGLVDTAVKTSRSGYLQRCLMKHLEELKVAYDLTVRDSGGNVIQFLYGEDGIDPMSSCLLGGEASQMLFLARNYRSLVHKYAIHENFLSQGFDIDGALRHKDLQRRAARLHGAAPGAKIREGAVVLARRRYGEDLDWRRTNLRPGWSLAEVTKVRKVASASGQEPSREYDLRYCDDIEFSGNGSSSNNGIKTEKHVPREIAVSAKQSMGGVAPGYYAHSLACPLIKTGIPDPAMSVLPLGSAIGACSEAVQRSIDEYIALNPEGILSATPSATTVAADAFEFLVWVKYMRSLACPGEAVGCVAAQSVGEPSTQMTLNTFHLAGHGGANVTLGIPRLREIIMTAAAKPKTPTMLIPLPHGSSMAAAKGLARQLSRLSFAELLSHKSGISVRESFQKDPTGWKRQYCVRFQFESLALIKENFGIGFDELLDVVKGSLMRRLRLVVSREARKMGVDAADFKSEGGDKVGGRGGADGEEGEEQVLGAVGSGRDLVDALLDGEDEVEEDDSDNDQGERDTAGYEDDGDNDLYGGADSEGDGENSTTAESPSLGVRSGSEGIITDQDSDSDSESLHSSSVSGSSPAHKYKSGSGKSKPKVTFDVTQEALYGLTVLDVGDKKGSSSAGVARGQETQVRASEGEGWAEVVMSLPAASRRLLLVQLAEAAAQHTSIHATKDIANAYALQCDVGGDASRVGVQTEGVNFEAVWGLPETLVDACELRSNDISTILHTYGVEAARKSIVSEVVGVFGVYGINVNLRHLSLIADFMTRAGSYIPMNRRGMDDCASPFLQMSFETTCTFLAKAAHDGSADMMESPSARIVLGKVPKVGTGAFDVLVPIEKH